MISNSDMSGSGRSLSCPRITNSLLTVWNLHIFITFQIFFTAVGPNKLDFATQNDMPVDLSLPTLAEEAAEEEEKERANNADEDVKGSGSTPVTPSVNSLQRGDSQGDKREARIRADPG